MAGIEELRERIDSAEDLQSIVRVMKTLSAVSITQYQHAARRLRAYQEVVDRGLHAVMMQGALERFEEPSVASPAGVIVFGSDQGLCGRFNEIVVSRALKWRKAHGHGGPVLVVGARGASRLAADGVVAEPVLPQPGSVSGLSHLAQSILIIIDDWRAKRSVEKVVTVFNAEASSAGVRSCVEVVMPMSREVLAEIGGRAWPSRQRPGFDGALRDVFPALIRERLYALVMRAGAESLAAEHSARLSAMQAADKNITERVEELQGDFRRERQDQITNELMDIVSAYQSMLSEQR